jgi:hypothetical protein
LIREAFEEVGFTKKNQSPAFDFPFGFAATALMRA